VTTSYLSWTDARLDGQWQGIRRLSLALSGTPLKATITVHLAQPPAGLKPSDLAIDGPRVPNIVSVTFDVVAMTATINLDSIGTPATYWVRLLSGGAHPLHPLFALASFQFAIDCESADCRPSEDVAPHVDRPAPPIDYATRDFTGFQQLLATHVTVRNDDWGDPAAASQEQMLSDLLAHHGDLLAYFQDRVANEAFVTTARTRHALRQHGLLLGYDVNEGVAGTTLLSFEVADDGWVPAGLPVRTETRDGDEPLFYTTQERTPVRIEHGLLTPAAWPGATTARVPAGTTRMLLWGHDLALREGQQLALHTATETFLIAIDSVLELALPGWVHAPTDPAPDPVTDPPAPVTEITWRAQQALPRDLLPWIDAAHGGDDLKIRGNLVMAVFGEPREASTHPDADGVPIRIELDDRSATLETINVGATQKYSVRALRLPESPLVWESRDGVVGPALDVEIDGLPWFLQPHLYSSRPFDRHYTIAVADDGIVWLQFGDGIHGERVIEDLPAHPHIRVRYRRGNPGNGNCPRDVLRIVEKPLDPAAVIDVQALNIISVTNAIAGTGGISSESDDAIRESIPRSLRHGPLERAVSLADYASIASSVPGVARATARALGGVFNTVMILVDPEGQADLDPDLRELVRSRIDHVRMAGREHVVAEARYVPLDIELWVCAEPGVPRHRVRERVIATLRPGTADHKGWFHPDRLSFAESVELGDVLAVVQTVPGVRSVKAKRFHRLIDPRAAVEARIVMQPTEVARLDADLSRPDNGRLEIKVVGLGGIDESDYKIAFGGTP
jgi:hypothetical protein